MNLVGTLGNTEIANPTPYSPGIRIFVVAQVVLFLIGIVAIGVFAPHWRWSALIFWK